MKAQTKALIASAVVIVLALSAVSGITYSWWSDSEEAQVNVTTGHLSLDVDLDTPYLSSGAGNTAGATLTKDTSDPAVAKFTYAGYIAAPGDVLVIPIEKAVISANIDTVYTEYFKIENAPYVTVKTSDLNSVAYNVGQTSVSGGHDIATSGSAITVEFDEDMPMNTAFTITYTFAVYQANATNIPYGNVQTVTTYSSGDNVSASVDNGDSGNKIGVSFNATTDGSITAKNVSEAEFRSTTYGMTSNGNYLGGVDVTGSSLSGTPVTLTFVVDGDVLVSSLTIYHGDSLFSASDLAASYDIATDKTTITFTTSAGFSAYYLVDNSVYNIYTPGDLKAVSENQTYWDKYIRLMNDIDLAGIAWTPIGHSGTQFNGTFDGNGKTITGLHVTNTSGVGVNSAWGLFGWSNGIIKDLTIEGATVTGNHFVGGIVGYIQKGTVENCVVKDSTITNTHSTDDLDGDKTGAIAGYVNSNMEYSIYSTVTNCKVEDVVLVGARDIGGIAGCISEKGAVLTYNTITDVTINIDQTGYTSFKTMNVGEVVGRLANNATDSQVSGNTATDVEKTYLIYSLNELQIVLKNWTTRGMDGFAAKLMNDLSLESDSTWRPADQTHVLQDVICTLSYEIDGNGHKITGLDYSLLDYIGNAKVTIRSLTLVDSIITSGPASTSDSGSGAFVNAGLDGASVSLIDCHLVNPVITRAVSAPHSNDLAQGGFIGFAQVNMTVDITDCSISEGSISGEGVGGFIGQVGVGAEVTVTGCSISSTTNVDGSNYGGAITGLNLGTITVSDYTNNTTCDLIGSNTYYDTDREGNVTHTYTGTITVASTSS